jgi:glycosyltransferase involved in cell wall biosynthesis
MSDEAKPLRLHLTNVIGTGATQLLKSLLPALERDSSVRIIDILLPDRGDLASYRAQSPQAHTAVYRRRLPNALSRLLECLVFTRRLDGPVPLLVLGDLPLRCNAPQTVFVQTSHLVTPSQAVWRAGGVKFAISRWVFRLNATRARAFIVQTDLMKDELLRSYPQIAARVHVIAQPVPTWLLESGLVRRARDRPADAQLSLVYPAAAYPHKNHRLLSKIAPADASDWPVDNLTLTIPGEQSPAPTIPWVRCVGFLAPERMIELYRRADALLFLSTAESYGFPLVEAMFVGLPVVCPDLPYARTLCGDGAIYFDPQSAESLRGAIATLHARLRSGWWPNWTARLVTTPRDWDSVARSMAVIAADARS